MRAVLLSGGSGSRLWPLSRETYPKQFLALAGARTMLQDTALRLQGLNQIPVAKAPVLVDAGVGTPSDAVLAMELGCDAVLMNTAIAEAKDPIRMARAMKLAVQAGRDAYLSGRMGTRRYADPSSPLAGLI